MASRESTSNFGPFLDMLRQGTSDLKLRMEILSLLAQRGPTVLADLMTMSGRGGSQFAVFFQAVTEAKNAGLVEFVTVDGKEVLRLSSAGQALVSREG